MGDTEEETVLFISVVNSDGNEPRIALTFLYGGGTYEGLQGDAYLEITWLCSLENSWLVVLLLHLKSN